MVSIICLHWMKIWKRILRGVVPRQVYHARDAGLHPAFTKPGFYHMWRRVRIHGATYETQDHSPTSNVEFVLNKFLQTANFVEDLEAGKFPSS